MAKNHQEEGEDIPEVRTRHQYSGHMNINQSKAGVHISSLGQSEAEYSPEEPFDDAIEHDAEVPALEGVSTNQKDQLQPGKADSEGRDASHNVRHEAGP